VKAAAAAIADVLANLGKGFSGDRSLRSRLGNALRRF